MKESDMYKPIKDYFNKLGYEVRAEVKNADVIALKNKDMVIIEMKKSLNTKVICQALQRKLVTEKVYIAVPSIKSYNKKETINVIYMLKRLELGLLLVKNIESNPYIEILLEPNKCSVDAIKARYSYRKYYEKEFNGRSIDGNIGGSFQEKILTAYKEKSIKIACIIIKHGNMTYKKLKDEFNLEKDAYNILRNNFYGWFELISRGLYGLSNKGKKEIKDYEELIRIINKSI